MKEYTNILISGGYLLSNELEDDLSKADGVRVDVTIKKHVDKPRSVPQNAYLWNTVYGEAHKHYVDNVGDFIRDLMLATNAGLSKDFIHEMFKNWLLSGKSTTKLSTEEMMEYIEKIREHFYHQHGLDIEEPK